MTVLRFSLGGTPELAARLHEDATSSDARAALSAQAFHEHVLWPQGDALHGVVEGDADADELADALLGFLGEGWTWRAGVVPGAEAVPIELRDERRSAVIVRMALEGEGTRCDVCNAVDPPPHDEDCPWAKRQGMAPDQQWGATLSPSGAELTPAELAPAERETVDA